MSLAQSKLIDEIGAASVTDRGAKVWRRLAVAALSAICLCAALGVGAAMSDPAAYATDPDLARLLKAMTLIKGAMALAATVAIGWRAGTALSVMWALGYGLSVAAMWSGVGAMWQLSHAAYAAVALHGGFFAALILLFRDPLVERALVRAVFRKATRNQ